MGKPIACCPYCGGDAFSESVRADAVNPRKPEQFAKVYGHWFNQCKGCEGWSIHRDGKQFAMQDKSKRPKPHSEPSLS